MITGRKFSTFRVAKNDDNSVLLPAEVSNFIALLKQDTSISSKYKYGISAVEKSLDGFTSMLTIKMLQSELLKERELKEKERELKVMEVSKERELKEKERELKEKERELKVMEVSKERELKVMEVSNERELKAMAIASEVKNSELRARTKSMLVAQHQNNVRGALEFIRSQYKSSRFGLKGGGDHALEEILKDAKVLSRIKTAAKEKNIRLDDVLRAGGGLYHTVSKHFHAHSSDVIKLYRSEWSGGEIICLHVLFDFYSIPHEIE